MVTVTIKSGVRRIGISERERQTLRRAADIAFDAAQAPCEKGKAALDAIIDLLDELRPEGEPEVTE